MARYVPSASLRIANPCSESWEAMEGSSRVRHCTACGHDVINVASLTPEQIEQHIEAARHGAPMPCMRIALFEDGALLTARREQRLGWLQRALAGLSALVVATSALAQGGSGPAVLTGRIMDASGVGVQDATVKLQQPGHPDILVKTGADGRFTAKAAPGSYALAAERAGYQRAVEQAVVLHQGQQQLPVAIRLGAQVFVTMGLPPLPPQQKPKDTTKPNPASNP